MRLSIGVVIFLLASSAYAATQVKISGSWESYVDSNGNGVASTQYKDGQPYFLLDFERKPMGCHYPLIALRTTSGQRLYSAGGIWSMRRMLQLRVVPYPQTWSDRMLFIHTPHSTYVKGVVLGDPAIMKRVLNQLENGTLVVAGLGAGNGKLSGWNSWSLDGSSAAIARAEMLCGQQ